MLQGEHILCFSTEDWDTPLPTNKHQLMVRLAKSGNLVLYVETLGIRKLTFQRTDLTRIVRRLKRAFAPPAEQIKNLVVISPAVFPARGEGLTLTLNKILFLPRLKKTLKRWQINKPIIWVFNPYAVHLVDSIPHRLLIYHCVDDLSRVPGANSQSLVEAERKLLHKAHLVFATSPSLYEKCRVFNQNTYFQPNVGDYVHFSKTALSTTPVAEAVIKLRHPIVMFAGNLAAAKVNFELITEIASRLIDYSVVLIGPLWKDVPEQRLSRLKKLPNLYMLPAVPYSELPSYLKVADVLIIPYLINEYTRSVFPIKFFEFLATGKPVVATPLPSLKQFANIVPMPETYQGFVHAITEAVKSGDANKDKRLELAKKNTWEHRLEELSQLITGALGKT